MIDGPVFAIGESSGLRVFSSAAAAEAEIDIEDEEERAGFFDSEGIELLPDVVEPVGRRTPAGGGSFDLGRPSSIATCSVAA